MVNVRPVTFATLLKRYRTNAGLTQEELAERADLSVRGVSALERGINRTPYVATLERLVEALELSESERAALEASISRRRGPDSPGTEPGSSALPVPSTSLIGRERDEAAAIHLLRWEGLRLLTLTGPGGVGKTRLALQIAASMAADFTGGSSFAPLAAVTDPDLVPASLAATLGLRDKTGRLPLDALIEHLRDREVLLLLDNFEQVTDAAISVAELLASCPKVKIIVTSRSPLHLRGEREIEVSPLPIPSLASSSVPELKQCASVTLFVERAQAVRRDFELTRENAQGVAQICIRLDGLPLAIELAAARTKVLSPQALLTRLDRSLTILVGQTRDAPDRQQTMRNTVAWSYDLLPVPEQALFRQLAVFSNGFEAEAVEGVCAILAPDVDVLERLSALVDKSLLIPSPEDKREPRFAMLETIREYASEQLQENAEAPVAEERHADYYLALVEAAEPELRGPNQQVWQERLEREHDNLRAALRWADRNGQVDTGLRIASALWWFWYVRGHLSEGLRWLMKFLERPGGTDRARGRALRGAGVLSVEQGDYAQGESFTEQALTIFRNLDEKRDVATALVVLGNVAKYRAQYSRTRDLYNQSLAVFREIDDRRSISVILNNLANLLKEQEVYDEAASLYRESLTIKRELQDKRGIAIALNNLGTCLHAQGNYGQARQAAQESLELLRSLEDKDMARALETLGRVALDQNDEVQAMQLYQESLRISQVAGDKDLIAFCLEGVGRVMAAKADWPGAAQLYAAAASLRTEAGIPLSPAEETQRLRYLTDAHNHLDEREFQLARNPGKGIPLEQAVALALNESPSREVAL